MSTAGVIEDFGQFSRLQQVIYGELSTSSVAPDVSPVAPTGAYFNFYQIQYTISRTGI